MDWQKISLIGGIAALTFVLLFKWNAFQDEQQLIAEANFNESNSQVLDSGLPQTPAATNDTPQVVDDSLPQLPSESAVPVVNDVSTDDNRLIHVVTDNLDLYIDRRGGDIVEASLLKHTVTLDGDEPFTILDNQSFAYYVSQSGLIGPNATDKAGERPMFATSSQRYELQEGADQLEVVLTLEQDNVLIDKVFTFTRDNYLIDIRYNIRNQSSAPWRANFYAQIKRDDHTPSAAADSGIGVRPYVGAATTTNDENYKEVQFDDLSSSKEEFSKQGGWVAMVQHYFVSAWVADKDATNNFFLRKLNQQNMYLFGFVSPETNIAAGETGSVGAQFYVGPKDIDKLEAIAEYLDLTIDFSFLWWIAKPLFYLLDFLHGYIGNWGWSIIALTMIIKAIFFYPSAISYRSMAKMRKLSPKMADLKERCGDDKQKLSKEMMALYKKEKVNPMSGCLPILIQMPVFISLYWVLMESVEIRHAPFMLWIQDLSVMDPYFVLPLLMGLTMFIQQKLNPTPPDPMQAKIMKWMPVAFTFMFLWFPAGLVVYWVTNNTLSIIQQWTITRSIEKQA